MILLIAIFILIITIIIVITNHKIINGGARRKKNRRKSKKNRKKNRKKKKGNMSSPANNAVGNNAVGNNAVGNNAVGNNDIGNNAVGDNDIGNIIYIGFPSGTTDDKSIYNIWDNHHNENNILDNNIFRSLNFGAKKFSAIIIDCNYSLISEIDELIIFCEKYIMNNGIIFIAGPNPRLSENIDPNYTKINDLHEQNTVSYNIANRLSKFKKIGMIGSLNDNFYTLYTLSANQNFIDSLNDSKYAINNPSIMPSNGICNSYYRQSSNFLFILKNVYSKDIKDIKEYAKKYFNFSTTSQ